MTHIHSTNMIKCIDMLLKYGNYTKAAENLSISQSYLTQTIKKIENELGVEIINRKSIPLHLTDAGKVYYDYLQSLAVEKVSFDKKIAKYSGTSVSVLRIGILPSLGADLLPLFMPAFLASYPETRFELHESLPRDNERKLLHGELDFFIGQNSETLSPNITVYNCGEHGYCAIIPKNSKFYQKEQLVIEKNSIPIKELLQEKLVLTSRGSAIRHQIDYLLQKYSVEPNIVLESDNIFTISKLAQESLGTTLLPQNIELYAHKGKYNMYPLSKEIISTNYFIAHLVEKTLLPAEKELISYFTTTLNAMAKSTWNYSTTSDAKPCV